MSIIILEGVDCVGKTTFAEMLAEKTGYEVVKGSSFEISELGADGMYNHMMELLDRKNIIIDRFFYSNLVYGKLYNYPMMDTLQYGGLVRKMDKNALLVYLHAPNYVIEHRMDNRGDDMIKADNIDNILNEYKDVLYSEYRPKMMLSIDTTESNFNVATGMVRDIIDLDLTKIYIKNT